MALLPSHLRATACSPLWRLLGRRAIRVALDKVVAGRRYEGFAGAAADLLPLAGQFGGKSGEPISE
jgi:hypothetical protein